MHRLAASIGSIAAVVAIMSCQEDPTTPISVAHVQRDAVVASDSLPQGPYAAVVLDSTPGASGQANDINDVGDIVGQRNDSAGATHAVLWHAGVMTDLGTLGGSSSAAFAINNHGTILGSATLADGKKHTVVWLNGTGVDLGVGGGGVLNDHDQVAFTTMVNGVPQAARWSNGHVQDLGTPGGPTSSAVAINDHGDVAGNGPDSTGLARAFVFSNGQLTVVPLLVENGPIAQSASGIDKQGNVVGTASWAASGVGHLIGWIWDGRSVQPINPSADFAAEALHNLRVGGVTSTGIVFGDVLNSNFDEPHVFRWTDGITTALVPGALNTDAEVVLGMNDAGIATGYLWVNSLLAYRAVVYENATIDTLGVAGPIRSRFSLSQGLAVDRWGDVVGWSNSTTFDAHTRPVLWRRTDVSQGHSLALVIGH